MKLRSCHAFVLTVLGLGLLACGCGNSESTGLFPTGPMGDLSKITTCNEKLSSAHSGRPSDQDCVEYAFSRRVLRLKHVNTAFNCCPEIEAGVTVRADTIFINEHESTGGCHCLCLYDLEYEIRGLKPDTYRVIVAQEYLIDTDKPLEFTIDLKASASGVYCVNRDHYPWGG
jgi:hypothetical protein